MPIAQKLNVQRKTETRFGISALKKAKSKTTGKSSKLLPSVTTEYIKNYHYLHTHFFVSSSQANTDAVYSPHFAELWRFADLDAKY